MGMRLPSLQHWTAFLDRFLRRKCSGKKSPFRSSGHIVSLSFEEAPLEVLEDRATPTSGLLADELLALELSDVAGGPSESQTAAWGGYAVEASTDAVAQLSDVPAYLWQHGCGPTAIGMLIGYWDMHGCPNLIAGDSSSQTSSVEEAIASTEHYNDYSLPIDNTGTGLLQDKSELGGAHTNNCIADWSETSWSSQGNYYGWTWLSAIDDATEGYAAAMGYGSFTAHNENWGAFTWNDFVAEIDAGRPMVFIVDTDANGSTDHFVTAIGYDDSTHRYACYDTWDTSVHWYNFAQMAPGRTYGIYAATFADPGIEEKVGVHRGSTWYLDVDGSESWNAGGDEVFSFGIAGDEPVVGDWNGDGRDEVGVYRSSTGTWYLDADGSGSWNVAGDTYFGFGIAGDEPVVGDWDGDGVDDIGVYRPSTGMWYLDADGSGAWNAAGDAYFSFGIANDAPVVGDWDGDGVDDVGVHRSSTGMWYLDADGSRAWNAAGDAYFAFGLSGDEPVVGDWNGDGTDEVGVHRGQAWYLDTDGSRQWSASGDDYFVFGLTGDDAVVGYWQTTAGGAQGSSAEANEAVTVLDVAGGLGAADGLILAPLSAASTDEGNSFASVGIDAVFAAESAAWPPESVDTATVSKPAVDQVKRSSRIITKATTAQEPDDTREETLEDLLQSLWWVGVDN